MLEVEKYKSGIKIKKSNRGKFTSYCGGEVTSACIQKGKNSSDPAVRKRATFAANARKWKHQIGGKIVETSDNTRVARPFNQPQIKVTRQQPQQAQFSALSEDEINRRKTAAIQRKREEQLYHNQHLWNVDPTKQVNRNNVGFAFNVAGIQGEPIRQGMAFATGAGAVRSIPKAVNALKGEAQIFGRSFNSTVPSTRIVNGLPRTTQVNPWIKGTKDMLQFWKRSPSKAVNAAKTYIVGDQIIAPAMDQGMNLYYKSQEPTVNLQYNGIQANQQVLDAINNGDAGIKEIFTD